MKKNEEFRLAGGAKDCGFCYNSQNPLIIAELGTSHNGDMAKAKEMIDAAAQAGALCVKFQMVFADEILHPNTGEVELPGGRIALYDRFKALETPLGFYGEIKEYAESKGLLFLCTPFGLKSASFLKELRPKMVKIASPELNFTSLLEEIALWNIPVLLSTGVSRLSDIENAVMIFQKKSLTEAQRHRGNKNEFKIKKEDISHSSLDTPHSTLCLLHCVTSYPAPETDYNLRVIPSLAAIFGVPVGVSDHSSDPELVPSLAVSLGAAVIEKHFCLSRKDDGLDDPIALEPDGFSLMVKAVKQTAKKNEKRKENKEPQISINYETINFYKSKHGEELIEKILGNGVKELAPSERANYRRTNRSIHALRDIAPGEILKKGDYAVLRTEKNLRSGLEPCFEKKIEGRSARQFIPSGEGIRFEDV